MLLPRELDMIEAGRHMPLPQPRPRGSELVVSNQNKRNVVAVRYDEHRPAATSSPGGGSCATTTFARSMLELRCSTRPIS